MANRIINYLVWAILITIALGIAWFLVEPIIWWSEKSEMRLYVRLFLTMFAVNTFAVLRLYNSIVQNTRFSIKLREAFVKFANSTPSLERAMKNLSSSVGSTKTSLDQLKRAVEANSDKADKLSERVNRSK